MIFKNVNQKFKSFFLGYNKETTIEQLCEFYKVPDIIIYLLTPTAYSNNRVENFHGNISH